MNTANNIVQLEDPLNTVNTTTRKVKKTTPTKTINKKQSRTKKVDNKSQSGYQSDTETVNEKNITKPKKKEITEKTHT